MLNDAAAFWWVGGDPSRASGEAAFMRGVHTLWVHHHALIPKTVAAPGPAAPPQVHFGTPTTNGYWHPQRYFRLKDDDDP